MTTLVISTDKLSTAAHLVEATADMLDHLVMDTPEDQALHARVVQSHRNAARAIRHLTQPPTLDEDTGLGDSTAALAQALATVDGNGHVFTSMTKSAHSARIASDYYAKAIAVTQALAALPGAPNAETTARTDPHETAR